jgi:hypothetical protein
MQDMSGDFLAAARRRFGATKVRATKERAACRQQANFNILQAQRADSSPRFHGTVKAIRSSGGSTLPLPPLAERGWGAFPKSRNRGTPASCGV